MATFKGRAGAERVIAQFGDALAGGGKVRVGFLENATYPDGKPVAMIAAIQEFGAPRANIPPRPFFRNMIRAKQSEWGLATALALRDSGYNPANALARVGEGITGQLRQSIIDTNSPPLRESTIVAKGGTAGMVYNAADPSTFPAKPLVHTGHMLNSVDYQVIA